MTAGLGVIFDSQKVQGVMAGWDEVSLGRAKLICLQTFNALNELESLIRTPFEPSAREHNECFSSSLGLGWISGSGLALSKWFLCPSPAGNKGP